MKTTWLMIPVIAATAFLSACHEDDVRGSVHVSAGYYGDGGGDDFYYVSSRPYSRYYGPLYYRDSRYYYRTGDRYVVYDRPTTVRRTKTVHNNYYTTDHADQSVVRTKRVVTNDDGDRTVVRKHQVVTY